MLRTIEITEEEARKLVDGLHLLMLRNPTKAEQRDCWILIERIDKRKEVKGIPYPRRPTHPPILECMNNSSQLMNSVQMLTEELKEFKECFQKMTEIVNKRR